MTAESDFRPSTNPPPSIPVDAECCRDPLELALSEFTAKKRQGKNPTVDEFAQRYPDISQQIRDLFPLVDNLERWTKDKEIECLRRNIPKEFSLDRLGDYQLVRELGRGGMGVVFQAFHLTSLRPVAIKLLPWRFAADMNVWRERLQREAATIAALKHPNIVPIYSFSEDQGYCYYVMQLVEGIGLDKIIPQLKQQQTRRRTSRQFFPTAELKQIGLTFDAWKGFAKIGQQVALALEHAHKQSVFHNDIKPSNLLVRANGQVIVTDFGIGNDQQGSASETTDSDSHSVGTFMYMAPERWNGLTGPASDLYSLGATLYELVTQSPLFEPTKRSQLIDAIQNQDPIAPRRICPDVPAPLERIILKSLSKDPVKRYPSAQAMADDLQKFIKRQPIDVSEQGVFGNFAIWWKDWKRSWRSS